MRVLIVDDHKEIRVRVRALLVEALPDAEISEAGNARTALRMAIASDWDVVIMDLHLGDGSGVNLIRHIAVARPTTKVLVLSAMSRDPYEAAARAAGASMFIDKQSMVEDLATEVLALIDRSEP